MERTRDRTSTPGHHEAGGREGITNDPSWQETLPETCDAHRSGNRAPAASTRRPAGCRAVRYVSRKAVMDPTPRSLDAGVNRDIHVVQWASVRNLTRRCTDG